MKKKDIVNFLRNYSLKELDFLSLKILESISKKYGVEKLNRNEMSDEYFRVYEIIFLFLNIRLELSKKNKNEINVDDFKEWVSIIKKMNHWNTFKNYENKIDKHHNFIKKEQNNFGNKKSNLSKSVEQIKKFVDLIKKYINSFEKIINSNSKTRELNIFILDFLFYILFYLFTLDDNLNNLNKFKFNFLENLFYDYSLNSQNLRIKMNESKFDKAKNYYHKLPNLNSDFIQWH